MDLSSWLPVVALLPPAVAAAYPLLRDRSHLTRIERVTQVLKASDDSSHSLSAGEAAVLVAVRRESVMALGLARLTRLGRGWLATGLWTGGYALLLVATQVWAFAIDNVVAWAAILSGVEVVVLGAGSVFAFWVYGAGRKGAREAVGNVVGPGPMVDQDGSPVDGS